LAIDPGKTEAMNALAFLLACHPGETSDASAADDATEAVELARKACAATDDVDPAFLDTLATALAAGGDYPAAAAAADRAVALAEQGGDDQLAAEIRLHRELFQAGKPFRPE
jgi:hypothetical protein